MTAIMALYGAPGCGSAIVEGILALAGIPFDYVDVTGFENDTPNRQRLLAVNPLGQVPVLMLPDGTIMTESAAIALYVADRHPALAPPVGHPDRARFLRLLVWIVVNIYPTFTYGDTPSRWAPSAPDELRGSTDAYRLTLYRWLETQVASPFALGQSPCVLDVYLAVFTAWRPRESWFAAQTPKIAAIAGRTRALPVLRAMCARNGFATDAASSDQGMPFPTPP